MLLKWDSIDFVKALEQIIFSLFIDTSCSSQLNPAYITGTLNIFEIELIIISTSSTVKPVLKDHPWDTTKMIS